MDGPGPFGEAQRRVATWLANEPGVILNESPDTLARTAVNLVVEVLNGRHVLVLKDSGWRLEHDLRCRIGMGKGCQFEGPLRVWMMEVGRPPQPSGRYVLGLDRKRRGQSAPITLEPE